MRCYYIENNSNQIYIQKLGEQRVLSQEIAKLASQAARGRLDAFPALQIAYNKFDDILKYQKVNLMYYD